MSLDGRGKQQHRPIYRVGECAGQQQLAARQRGSRVLEVRAAKLRPAFEDVGDIVIEEQEVHVRYRQVGRRIIYECMAEPIARDLRWCCCSASRLPHAASPLRDGDIIFHTSRSAQSQAIQRATHSPYSHVGWSFHRDGKPFVFEAIATVRYTPLAQWTARGRSGDYVVKRLKAPLTADQADKLRKAAETYAGKPYDLYFEWSDARIYCSELVWKAYQDASASSSARARNCATSI